MSTTAPHPSTTPAATASVSVVIINKDEPGVFDTIAAVQAHEHGRDVEIVVVDASAGRFEERRREHPGITWVDFRPIPGVVTIPHQRNAGVAAAGGDIIAFTDASCLPDDGWLDRLTQPLVDGTEQITAGATRGRGSGTLYDDGLGGDRPHGTDWSAAGPDGPVYVDECPTVNMAFTRELFERVGGFDESYRYGSDVDFCWRVRHTGTRIRRLSDAVVVHDWGTPRRQLKRAFQYGEARARLYAKHPWKLSDGPRNDPILFAYPAFLLALPLALHRRLRWLPLLLVVPLVRNRGSRPLLTVADHLSYGAGALYHLAGRIGRRR